MKNHIQPGGSLRLIAPSGGVVSGRPYAVGGITGIAAETEIEGGSFELAREGVYSVAKDDSEFAPGDAVYALGGEATGDTAGDFLGYATAAAADSASEVEVLLVTKYVPAAGYTELVFTWWQSGTSAPVILQTLANTTGLTVSGFGRSGTGQMRLALSGTLSATVGKVTIETNGQNEDGTAARIFNPSTTGVFVYIKIFDAAGTLVDNVGNGTTLYASTTIRIYP